MRALSFSLYHLVLALWAGGITVFTLIVTPAIFLAYGRDMAGQIVGNLFPGYFRYNLILSVLAFVLFFLTGADRSGPLAKLCLGLLAAALVVNLFIAFKLHPDAVRIKQQIVSFESEPADSPVRGQFRRLHGLSAALNLFLLIDGIVLLVSAPLLRK